MSYEGEPIQTAVESAVAEYAATSPQPRTEQHFHLDTPGEEPGFPLDRDLDLTENPTGVVVFGEDGTSAFLELPGIEELQGGDFVAVNPIAE